MIYENTILGMLNSLKTTEYGVKDFNKIEILINNKSLIKIIFGLCDWMDKIKDTYNSLNFITYIYYKSL